MLVSLLVKNFAIIDNINIEFADNMTVLTGETGAGKSLIIDAIGLLFANRASAELVRHGETKAVIEGVFTRLNPKLVNILQEKEIEISTDDVLTIKREIYDSGKSTCRINEYSVSLATLSEISEYIGDIHTQFDTQKLTNPKNYLSFIDDEQVSLWLLTYNEELKKYQQIVKEYNRLLTQEAEGKEKLSFYHYQIDEIAKAAISVTEEQELHERANILNNYETIVTNINQFRDLYEQNNLLDCIYQSLSLLNKVEKFDKKYMNYRNRIEDSYYNLNDVVSEILADFKKDDIDLHELEEINTRLGLYSDLKRKYKMNTAEIVAYYQKISEEIEQIENFDVILADLKQQRDDSYHKTLSWGRKISEHRQQLADNFVDKIKFTLKDLQLKDVQFEVRFMQEKLELKKDGIDTIDFMISFNKGEPVKSLAKTASGGELSRFMLALKTLVSHKLELQTLIFDEIDNGVSGEIAFSIASKIKEISLNAQVLCVTHLPQVAAIADHHLKISKKVSNNRTVTNIENLTYPERVDEIAMMISNGQITTASKNLAIELLNQ
ncbi:MAG TPA: DNA repair protein RecN [Bacilli bacterium]|jgi:DNA repair protein RecN (Recombination protein N)|nr:DNA repair protein RecN [Bacilli bacterium]HOH61692.1 DNA repair protein RecN [Bacilli bacterium]HPB49202.1 DNA repair protein RecN [Bacilli bacterium]HPM15463.1 DNA repair protein RecN [Bacilli bacterium]HPY54102.1 DNA repair protein RecN [Bacilli bacterium]